MTQRSVLSALRLNSGLLPPEAARELVDRRGVACQEAGGAGRPGRDYVCAPAAVNRRAAIDVCDDVVTRFDDASEPALLEQVATALVSKASALGELERSQEEIDVYDDVVTRFDDASEPALLDRVATALVSKASALGELERSQEEIDVRAEFVTRFGDTSDPMLRFLVDLSRANVSTES